MKKRVFILTVVVMALSTSFQPASVGAQGPNTYTSIIVTDVVSGAPVVGSTFVTNVKVSITNNAAPAVGVMGVELWLPFDPILADVAQDIGQLEGDAEFDSIRQRVVALKANNVHRHQADGRRHAVAIFS